MPTGHTSTDKSHNHGFVMNNDGSGHTTISLHSNNPNAIQGPIPLGGNSHDHAIVNGQVMAAIGADGNPHAHSIPVKQTPNGFESAR